MTFIEGSPCLQQNSLSRHSKSLLVGAPKSNPKRPHFANSSNVRVGTNPRAIARKVRPTPRSGCIRAEKVHRTPFAPQQVFLFSNLERDPSNRAVFGNNKRSLRITVSTLPQPGRAPVLRRAVPPPKVELSTRRLRCRRWRPCQRRRWGRQWCRCFVRKYVTKRMQQSKR